VSVLATVAVRVLASLVLLLVNGVVLILMLRKVLGHLHIRLGPTRVGPRGAFQTVADVLKLLTKEDFRPSATDKWLFRLAPLVVFVPSFMAYCVFAYSPTLRVTDLDSGLLMVLAISSLVPIGIMMAGWASNSKWSLLGGMRAAGQQIAYEVPLLLAVLGPVMMAGSLRMADIVAAQRGVWFGVLPRWFVLPQLVAFVLFAIAGQAETNQTPFDMSEAESELVTGFANEYSGMRFAFMFLAEFSNMFIISAIGVTVFFGGWLLPWIDDTGWAATVAPLVFVIKVYLGIFVMMWIRGTLPRIRIDQMLSFSWKMLIPVSLAWVTLSAVVFRLVRP
jgi:NADH-quinone oxidoreductase subunit H